MKHAQPMGSMWNESSRTVSQDSRAGCRVACGKQLVLSIFGELPTWILNPSLQQVELILLFPAVAQKVVALRKKQQLAIGPCKSLPNSPSHSAVSAASIPAVHINQVRNFPVSQAPFTSLNSQPAVAPVLSLAWVASVWPLPCGGCGGAPCPGLCTLHSTVFPRHEHVLL